ncbi:efflux transporter outer membrane subunit [Falsiroseomonas selenitidurans]|uniref:Efflux transporter outer membrane subunit n=1 Tax=Falsiroseomonas selenitidurans TaxID=2716335 RepID=A0ABX1E1P9_9PROT|nr:efflux transporter outer membrane subunit [Falsiroseomonas selenitidurans]NKC29738.1 efflux transporter outer membrane subunit [Falsiroseomonas selenitidurans]
MVARRLLLLVLGLAGCAVGPDHARPPPPSVADYTLGGPVLGTVAAPGPAGAAQHFRHGAAVPEAWWRIFGSATLDALVQDGTGNLELRAALARLRQAQALLRAAGGALFPAVDLEAAATRQRPGGGSLSSGAAAGGGGPQVFDVVTAAGTVSYRLDLFGRARRAMEAQAAETAQALWALQAARLSVANNIVASALAQARLRGRIAARQALIAAQQRQIGLIRARVGAGAASDAALVSAQAELAEIRAPLPRLAQELAVAQHRLAVLVGRPPGLFAPPALQLGDLRLPVALPVVLPAALVRRRPDILAAEAALQAASARIGVATAGLYPDVTLDASYGLGSAAPRGAGLAFSPFWSLGASLLQPLFRGGRLRAERDAAIAAFEAAEADYRATVLGAFAEVANALRALQNDAAALRAAREAVQAARRSLELAQLRYEAGATDFTAVLVARQQFQRALLNEVDAVAGRFQDTTALFAALGGGVAEAPLALAEAGR